MADTVLGRYVFISNMADTNRDAPRPPRVRARADARNMQAQASAANLRSLNNVLCRSSVEVPPMSRSSPGSEGVSWARRHTWCRMRLRPSRAMPPRPSLWWSAPQPRPRGPPVLRQGPKGRCGAAAQRSQRGFAQRRRPRPRGRRRCVKSVGGWGWDEVNTERGNTMRYCKLGIGLAQRNSSTDP